MNDCKHTEHHIGSAGRMGRALTWDSGRPGQVEWERCLKAEAEPADDDTEAQRMTASLLRAIERDPNPNGRWKGAIVSESGTALLIDVPDEDGVRTFLLNVREV